MIISGPQAGSFEGIWIQMNVGFVDTLGFAQSTLGFGANLRGFLAFLDLDGGSTQNQNAVANVPFGQAAQIGHFDTVSTTARSPKNALLGVVDQNLILGTSPVASGPSPNNQYQTNFWCKIQCYGHSSTIKVIRSSYVVADEFLFDAPSSDVGVAGSVSAATLNAMNTMTGLFTFDAGGGGAGDQIDLSGANSTAGTWSTTPITARAINKPYPTRCFLGWSYTGAVSGAVRDIKELNTNLGSWNATFGEVSGFISCMSPSPRG